MFSCSMVSTVALYACGTPRICSTASVACSSSLKYIYQTPSVNNANFKRLRQPKWSMHLKYFVGGVLLLEVFTYLFTCLSFSIKTSLTLVELQPGCQIHSFLPKGDGVKPRPLGARGLRGHVAREFQQWCALCCVDDLLYRSSKLGVCRRGGAGPP
jgi:hypothetical protein